MRPLTGVYVLAVGSVLLLGLFFFSTGSAATEEGPRSWELGMEWAWESEDARQETRVYDHKRLMTDSGMYDVWRTQTRHEDDQRSAHRVTMWEEGTHRRVHEEVTFQQDGSPLTALIQYDPPAPFPMWEGIAPGTVVNEEITEYTSYRSGFQHAGQEEPTTWDWYTIAGQDVYELETPAGTFEGFNVTVYMEEVDGEDQALYEYFYAFEARHFVATFDAEDALDMRLTSYDLVPRPVARALSGSSIVSVGEEVTLSGGASYALDGEIDRYEWRLPPGTVLENETLTEETLVEAREVEVRFEEEDRYRMVLNVTGTNGRSAEDPVIVRVVEREDTYRVDGKPFAIAGEASTFRLFPPAGASVDEAVWEAEGVESVTGLEAEIMFPSAGSYTLTVTYTDSEGTTGELAHDVIVVQGSGLAEREGTSFSDADPIGPAILAPENGTVVGDRQMLVVARVSGLEDPALLMPNGLRVPLEGDGHVTSAQVPLPAKDTLVRLVAGDAIVDAITVHYDEAKAQTSAPDDAGPNEAPFPWLLPFALAPLLRRKRR